MCCLAPAQTPFPSMSPGIVIGKHSCHHFRRAHLPYQTAWTPVSGPSTLGTVQPTHPLVTMYSLQISWLLRPKFLSISRISPSPKSKTESNIQQEPATFAYAPVF